MALMKFLPEGFAREYHERFVRRALQGKEVWALVSPNGKMACVDSNRFPARTVTLFWSDRAYAQRCAKGPWSDRVAKPIQLERLLGHFLPAMHRDRWLVGCNWDAELVGLEVEPLDLLHELLPAWTDQIRQIVEALSPHPVLDDNAPLADSTGSVRARLSRPRRVRAAAPSEFNDGTLRLVVPSRPWRVVRELSEGVLFDLRYGRAASAPSLRVLKGNFPSDEADWCQKRFVQAMSAYGSSPSRTPENRLRFGRRYWNQFELSVAESDPFETARLRGRSYVVARPWKFTRYFRWIFLDLPRGQRVLEVETEYTRHANDLREFARVIETIEPAP